VAVSILRVSAGLHLEEQGKAEDGSGNRESGMFQCASVRSSSDETPHNIIRGDQVGREACQEQGRSDYQTPAISREASWSHRLAPVENVALFALFY
jgi:hypothetical protein